MFPCIVHLFARAIPQPEGYEQFHLGLETLKKLDVKNAKVSVVDKGALDCTLKARVEGAVFRSINDDPDTPNPWEVL